MAAILAIVTLLLLAAPHLTWQASLPIDPSYLAGVVEFVPLEHVPNSARTNVNNMKQILESEDAKDLDIIVFPEYVLSNMEQKTFVPDPESRIAPCDSTENYAYFLVELSCAARKSKLYVVVNMVEKTPCVPGVEADCDKSGLKTYNTNVVLDRQGVVVSRYRKTNLYLDEKYNTNIMPTPQHAIFTTDFGVTFGHFICFDMVFYDPAMVLIREYNVTDILYPTYWFSGLPFVTALQMQEGFAYANNINLLAAGASAPGGQTTGSGIYAGKHGRLVAVIHEEPTTRLLKARVPKRNHLPEYQLPHVEQPAFEPQLEMPRYTKMALSYDNTVETMTTKLLPADFTTASETLCHESLCCKFDVRRTLISNSADHVAYRYRLAAFGGLKANFHRTDFIDSSNCAIIACTSDEVWSCGRIFSAERVVGNKYYFSELKISGTFRHADRRLIMPSSVDGVIRPVPVSNFKMVQSERDNGTYAEIALTAPKADLLTFGIWVNYYNKNKIAPLPTIDDSKELATTGVSRSMIALILAALVGFILYKKINVKSKVH